MNEPPSPRDRSARIADTRHRLEHDVDVWVATSAPDGGPPGLVPLSFDWDGHELLLATPRESPAGRNMRASGLARLALGLVRDVVLIDATAREREMDDVPESRWAAYAHRTGWDPRDVGSAYAAYLLAPVRVQAWRESNELAGRTLMREGTWLEGPADPSVAPRR